LPVHLLAFLQQLLVPLLLNLFIYSIACFPRFNASPHRLALSSAPHETNIAMIAWISSGA